MKKIILIEPDVLLAGVYAAALRGEGFEVRHATHAEDAIRIADALKPDLVITELQLAAHNGVEFLYEFRTYGDWLRIPIMVLSSVHPHAVGVTPQLMQTLGIKQYLYKPSTNLKVLCRSVTATFQEVA